MRGDVIVVGAGSAGAALAARLSEDSRRQVLLLEAGPNYRTADTPAAMRLANATGIVRRSAYQRFRWDDLMARRTDRQPPRPYVRGRGLGGSSAVNGLVAIRGLLDDFDQWAALGCDGWSGADVLPSFIRLEDDLNFGDAPYHGSGGPIPIWRAPLDEWGAVDRALREAALAMGYPWADDHNAPDSTGVSPFAINSRGGVRVSTNDGYLEPARGRPNLTIVGDALVDRVLIESGQAIGVRARIADQWQTIEAGEVVICAGAIHSPALLLRSGIGPAGHLRELGLPVVSDLPVGEGVLDHAAVSLGLALRPAARAQSVEQRTTNCCVRYASGLAGAGLNDMLMRGWNIDGDDEASLERGHIMVSTYENHSRGRLWLTSTDPTAAPTIDLRLLSDERDLVRLRDGLRRLVELMAQPAIGVIADTIAQPHLNGVPVDMDDDAAVDEWLLEHCHDVAHIAGTCRMGRPSTPHTVVDPRGHVVGIDRLRVVDASIMPLMVRANIHLTTVMLAEHLAARWSE